MYLLDELTREHQKELLHDAELLRIFKQFEEQDVKVPVRLRNALGDMLISSGLRLKGQRPIMHRYV